MSSKLGIPEDIANEAYSIYKRAHNKGLLKGRSVEGVAGASLYIACRQNGTLRDLDEIGESTRVSRKEIGRTYRYVASELGINLEPVEPREYVPRYCSLLNLSEEVESEAKEILKKIPKEMLTSGIDPTNIAATVIYIANIECGEGKSKKEISKATNTTEMTIRKRHQEICNVLDMELSKPNVEEANKTSIHWKSATYQKLNK